jgi:transcriptional regulator with XRE-family HTH domain
VTRSIGRTLGLVRRARGLTQAELADRLGVIRTTVSRWERGEQTPSLEQLGPLTRALRVRPEIWIDLPARSVERWFVE